MLRGAGALKWVEILSGDGREKMVLVTCIYISRSEVITSVGTISSGTAYLLHEVCCWIPGHSERDQGKELVQ